MCGSAAGEGSGKVDAGACHKHCCCGAGFVVPLGVAMASSGTLSPVHVNLRAACAAVARAIAATRFEVFCAG